jgi:hypothetical protein
VADWNFLDSPERLRTNEECDPCNVKQTNKPYKSVVGRHYNGLWRIQEALAFGKRGKKEGSRFRGTHTGLLELPNAAPDL